jgi:4-amino-4-deoxy-L-arabinose transferase-like glycosyltransferase
VGADEAFYQSIAETMLHSGDWFRLKSGRSVYVYDTFANAPLQYWARGLVVSWIGKSTLSMRILSSASALLAVLATYRLALHLAGRRAGLVAGLSLITTFQFLYLHSARTGELEPTVCLLLVCLAHLFIRAVEDPSRGLLLHHICLGLLVNLKAPVIVIPLVAELACFALLPRTRARLGPWLRLGLLVAPVALAWHIVQAWQYRDALLGVLLSVEHQASGDFAVGPASGLMGRFDYYARRLIFGAFPYVLLYPIALTRLLLPARTGGSSRETSAGGLRIIFIYTLTILLFYLGISKVGPWYIVHAYPFLSIALGVWLSRLEDGAATTAALVYVSAALSLMVWLRPEMIGFNPFAMDAYVIPMRTSWRSIGGLPAAVGVPLLAGLLSGALLMWRRSSGPAFAAPLAAMLLTAFFGYASVRSSLPLEHLETLSPVAALAADLEDRRRSGQNIPLPIEVPKAHPWIVEYYFSHDYDVRQTRTGDAVRFRRPTIHYLHENEAERHTTDRVR